jgi:hypothetical protein
LGYNWKRDKLPANKLSYGLVVEAWTSIEAVRVYRTWGGLVVLRCWKQIENTNVSWHRIDTYVAHCDRCGWCAGTGYVGGLARVDPAVPCCSLFYHENWPLPKQRIIMSGVRVEVSSRYFFVSMDAWRAVRRAPSLYQAMAGEG